MAEFHSEQAHGDGRGAGYSAFSARHDEQSNEPIACRRCRKQKVWMSQPIPLRLINRRELHLQCRLIGPLILNLVLDSSCGARRRNRPAGDVRAFQSSVLIRLHRTEGFWQLKEHGIPNFISTENLKPLTPKSGKKPPMLLVDPQLFKKQLRCLLEWPCFLLGYTFLVIGMLSWWSTSPALLLITSITKSPISYL